ncbi:hypothetical protein CMK18_16680 [Candidatus Poribacteria bacterium]|nr:hypothetical protein [Candidatus Poribacteria bacterium]
MATRSPTFRFWGYPRFQEQVEKKQLNLWPIFQRMSEGRLNNYGKKFILELTWYLDLCLGNRLFHYGLLSNIKP